jgi:hypothetical protein
MTSGFLMLRRQYVTSQVSCNMWFKVVAQRMLTECAFFEAHEAIPPSQLATSQSLWPERYNQEGRTMITGFLSRRHHSYPSGRYSAPARMAAGTVP